ncbi:hypothetical protein PYCCODRAFT_1469945 [Trametes coccinea BRFM310]|uniref:Uncharacterized protein n=1 Tax=Trametes coccinea (strain BRFM310) TaxID=1353009 RepID=A0A1Y2IFA6_TRAC3|nr:hypothetical protein PYCCODRAFT_1469945 [Trametes coccinea BRFM310]
MPSTTYHERVQTIFSVLAQHDQSSILLLDFVERVKDSMALDLIPPRPRVVAQVHKALRHERLARRIKLVQCADGQIRLELTPSGLTYFRNHNVVRLHHMEHDVLHRLTARELRKETKILNDVLREIRDDIRGSSQTHSGLTAYEDMPHIILTLIERIDALHAQNTELTSMLAEDRGMEHNILAGYSLYD